MKKRHRSAVASGFSHTSNQLGFAHRRSSAAVTSCVLAVLGVTPAATLAQSVWTNPLGGSAATAANWSGGVPTSSSTVRFNLPAAYSVSFPATSAAGQTFIEAGDVTFDLLGQTYSTNSSPINVGLTYASSAYSSAARLVVKGGKLATTGLLNAAATVDIVNAAQVEASTIIIDHDAAMSADGAGAGIRWNSSMYIGAQTSGGPSLGGTLALTNGASASSLNGSSASIRLADLAGSTGRLLLDGNATRLTGGQLTIGDDGTAIVDIRNGGVMSAGRIDSAGNSTGRAQITVDHATLNATDLTLGGSGLFVSTIAGSASVAIVNGGIVRLGAASTGTMAMVGNASRIDLSDGSLFGSGQIANSGLIRGAGRIGMTISNGIAGRVEVPRTATLWLDAAQIGGSGHTNAGTIVVAGQLEAAGRLTNQSTGLVSVDTAAVRFANTSNSGSLIFTNGYSTWSGKIDNQTGARITVATGATAVFDDDVNNNGTIKVANGAAALFLGAISGSGSFSGTGPIELEGDLRPGNSPGIVHFGGNLLLASSADLEIELAGLARGTEYDAVDVTGQLTIDDGSSFHVKSWNGFKPLPGQRYDVVQYGDHAGTFGAPVNDTGLAGLQFSADYTSTGITLVTSGRAGDANLDAQVNFDDLILLAQHYGQTAGQTWLTGDFTDDGVVNFDDLIPLAQNYGTPPSSFAAEWALAQSLVPEPTTLVLGTTMLPMLSRRRRV